MFRAPRPPVGPLHRPPSVTTQLAETTTDQPRRAKTVGVRIQRPFFFFFVPVYYPRRIAMRVHDRRVRLQYVITRDVREQRPRFPKTRLCVRPNAHPRPGEGVREGRRQNIRLETSQDTTITIMIIITF